MKKLVYLLVSLVFAFSACTPTETVRYTVASEYGDCVGVAPMKCMYVKKADQPDWEFFYNEIEGFNYEEGYEYVIEVKTEPVENAPADASAIKYVLVNEISKTPTTSTNLPKIPAKVNGYELTGQVLGIESVNIGRGAAEGEINVTVVEVKVTSSVNPDIKEGDIVFCELIDSPQATPKVGTEYVFKAASKHPAHVKEAYFLETDAIDLI